MNTSKSRTKTTSAHSDGGSDPIRSVVVLGGGTAGLLAALTLKRKIPALDVEVIRSKEIGVISVGEGSLFTLPIFLHGVLGIDPGTFHRAVRPTYKLGIRFDWGSRDRFNYTFSPQLNRHFSRLPKPYGYYCRDEFDFADVSSSMMEQGKAFARQESGAPIVPENAAYHLENKRFVDFLEMAAGLAGITLTDDTLSEAVPGKKGIESLKLASGRCAQADLYIDCSGFRSALLGKALGEPFVPFDSSLFCDRAIVGGWPRDDETLHAFTTAETMDAGWAWQIEHEPTVNRGYVYSSSFISDDEAEREFREKNPKLGDTRVIKFTTGRYRRSWVGNVVALGNSAGFVEPLEATAIGVITNHSNVLVHVLRDTDLRLSESQTDLYNCGCESEWDEIRRFLALHYKFNTRLDTPFWKAAREDTDLAGAEEIVEQFQAIGPSRSWGSQLLGHGFFGMEGYLVMLVGMQVPYRSHYAPSAEELALWEKIRSGFRERGRSALTQEEALRRSRSEKWQWRPEFYTELAKKNYGIGAASFSVA